MLISSLVILNIALHSGEAVHSVSLLHSYVLALDAKAHLGDLPLRVRKSQVSQTFGSFFILWKNFYGTIDFGGLGVHHNQRSHSKEEP